MNELLNKFLEGEISEDEYNKKVSELDEEGKKQHEELLAKPETRAMLKKKADEELERVNGLRKERQRLEQNPPKPDSDYASQLRKENIGKAATKFFSDFGIAPEQQAEYQTAFEQSGNQAVSEEYIYEAFEAIYATKNSKELLRKARERDQMTQGGEEFNADNAGNPGGSGDGGGDSGKKRDPKVLEWMQEMHKQGKAISYEDAERVLNRGLTRKFGI